MPAISHQRRHDLYALLLLLMVSLATFADVLVGYKSLFMRDITRYYYPTKRIIREVILGGSMPFWNPYYSAGQPMAANPEYEVFYPPQWLILLPSYDLGFRLHILLHVFLAAAGMYLLLRSMRLLIPTAFFGAASFAFGGFYLSLVNLLPLLFCVTWMPWILMFMRRQMRQPNAFNFAGGALMVGIQLLAIEPMTVIQTWVLASIYGFYEAMSRPDAKFKRLLRNAGITLSVLFAGVLIGGVQFIPAIDHSLESSRSRPFDFTLVTAWSMPLLKPVELLFPNLMGHISHRGTMWFWGGGLYPGMGSPFIYSIYLGFFAVALMAGAFLTPRRAAWPVALVLVISTLLALGGNTPLYRFLYDAGIGTSMRYPEKFATMGLFALIVFAAIAFDRLLRGDEELRASMVGFVAGTTLLALIVACLSHTSIFERYFRVAWSVTSVPNLKFMVGLSQIDWWVAFARGAILLALLVALRKWGPNRVWLTASLIYVLADLTPVALQVNPRMPKGFFTPPPISLKLPPDRPSYRIFHESDWYGSTEVAKTWFSTGKDVYWIVRNGMFPMTSSSWGFRTVLERDYDKTALLATVDLTEAMWAVKKEGRKDWRNIFTAMSNAAIRTEYRNFEAEKKRLAGNMTNTQPIEFVNAGRNPRYYFAEQVVSFSGKQDFIHKLVKGTFHRKVAFIEQRVFAPASGKVLRARERPNTIELDVEADGKSLLVLSVTPHKFWSATLDGKAVSLLPVNLGYQGVVVPRGRHSLRLVYRNTLIIVMGIITLLTLSAAVVTLIRFRHLATAQAGPDSDHIDEHSGRISKNVHPAVGRVEPEHGDLDH